VVGDLSYFGATIQDPKLLTNGVTDMLITFVVKTFVEVGYDKPCDIMLLREDNWMSRRVWNWSFGQLATSPE
jgi:hypothetical protein